MGGFSAAMALCSGWLLSLYAASALISNIISCSAVRVLCSSTVALPVSETVSTA